MTTQLQFELVTPEKLYVSKPAAMVTVPGGEGDYGVLAGHAPMITTVKPGVINVYAENENTLTESIFVAGGFAEVTADRCTILAEEAVSTVHIDRESVELHIKMLLENAVAIKTDAERDTYEKDLAIARAKLEAVAA